MWNPMKLFGGGGAEPASPVAGMAQSQWQWFAQNVLPAQQKLYDQSIGPQALERNLDQAQDDVATQFNALPAKQERQFSDLGVAPNPAQQAALDKSTALGRGIADVTAANNTRATTAAQARGVLGV